MRHRIPLIAAAMGLACAAPATAQQGAGDPVRIVISKLDCSRLVRHVPSGDVAYRPGEGVGGRKVAPADLDDTGADMKFLPDVLEFNVAINPMTYGSQARSAQQLALLNKQKAANAAAQVANQGAVEAAYQQKAQLGVTKDELAAKQATLAAEKAAADAALAPLQAQVDAGTLSRFDRTYKAAKAAAEAKQTEVAANDSAIAANTTAIAQQSAIIDPAKAQLATLTATGTQLAASRAQLVAEKTALDAALAPLAAQVAAGTLSRFDSAYKSAKAAVEAKQAQIDTTDQAIATNTRAVASAQASVDAGVSPDKTLKQSATVIEGQIAEAEAAKAAGAQFSNTSMNVAAVRYDLLKGELTINGQPVGPRDQQALADACRKRGVR